jgi:predicted negative regulator of RcsB-dependent stress response
MAPAPPPAPPLINLDGQALLDFIAAQNQKERDYFDRLLKWFGIGITVVLAVLGGLFTVFGYQNYTAVQKVSEDLRAETKTQLVKAVSEELTNLIFAFYISLKSGR